MHFGQITRSNGAGVGRRGRTREERVTEIFCRVIAKWLRLRVRCCGGTDDLCQSGVLRMLQQNTGRPIPQHQDSGKHQRWNFRNCSLHGLDLKARPLGCAFKQMNRELSVGYRKACQQSCSAQGPPMVGRQEQQGVGERVSGGGGRRTRQRFAGFRANGR